MNCDEEGEREEEDGSAVEGDGEGVLVGEDG